jgi:hypothetical protein
MVSLKKGLTDMVAVGKFGVENHAKVFDPNFTKYIKILN